MNAVSVNPNSGLQGIRQLNEPEEFSSMALEFFAQSISKNPQGKLLDVGPVSSANINFFANRIKKLFICDLFIRLEKYQRNGLSSARILADLDYDAESFDGILIWDLLDRLNDEHARSLAIRCLEMTKPGGFVLSFALGQKGFTSEVYSFSLQKEYNVLPTRQYHINLPRDFRQNREMLELMSPFVSVKNYRYRNGFREFLFQKPN